MSHREESEAEYAAFDQIGELTDGDRIKAMMDFWRYSREEAIAMLIDAGEIEEGWCGG